MKKRKLALARLTLFVFLLTNIFADYSYTFAATLKGNEKVAKEKVQILIKYKDDSKSNSVKSNAKSKLKISKLDSKKKYKLSKAEILEIGSNDDINGVVAELKKDTNVAYVQPNYKLKPSSIQFDERYEEQWGLNNVGQTFQYQEGVAGVDINAEKAWEITEGSPSVLVGVVDTGIDINHDDLKENIFVNTNEISDNGIDDDGNGYIDDVYGWDFANEDNTVFDSATSDTHGTQVSGIIAASAEGIGIRGVAPKVKILPLKFINNGEGYTSDVMDAIEYAKQMGVKIMNCSFGGSEENAALKDTMANSDMLFICASGNNGSNVENTPIYPAAFDLTNVISVAAVDNSGKLASFSNYGTGVTVAAPGVSIISTIPDNMYNFISGTSISAAFVTGTAALIKSTTNDITIAQMAARLSKSVRELDDLKSKIKSQGIIDAAKALDSSLDADTGSSTTTTPAPTDSSNKGKMVIPLAVAVSDALMEQVHYGENGVSISSGNYSTSVTDMSVKAPGFTVNISRTYNSKDDRAASVLGRGWFFGFEGSLKQDPSSGLWIAKLPNSAAQVFQQVSNYNSSTGTYVYSYVANDSHSTLVKQADNSYILTAKDQYTYGFSSAGYLIWMKDKNGNAINITIDSNGKVDKIKDTVGREYTVIYTNPTTKDYISSISDPMGRKVKYEYDTNSLLWKVTDANNNIIATYEYDSSKYLTTIKDYYGNATEQLVYDHASGTHKVQKYTDVYGKATIFSYDTGNRITTITDNSTPTPRTIKKWYDSAMYVIKTQDPEGMYTTVEYYADPNGFNKYGEEKSIIDRNGNKIQYERDVNGNITKITNPDGSIKEATYDDKNNQIMEKDETAKYTYFIYDSAKINVLKEVKPLNGKDAYNENAEQNSFAITKYFYYTNEEAVTLGYKAKGLLKSKVDPEGHETKYEYDQYGNVVAVTDGEGNITKNSYNVIGWLTSTTSPKGYKTSYYYDNNGLLEKTVLNGGETTRTVYDPMGRVLKVISPNEYNPEKEVVETRGYSDATVGKRYEYYTYGKVKAETLPEKDPVSNQYYKTSYNYDIYGNLTTETKANGATYTYEYDAMNRLVKVIFKADAQVVAEVLKTYSYAILADKRTTITETKYFSDTETAVTVTTANYAGNVVEQLLPNNTKLVTVYNPNGTISSKTDGNGNTTYFRYDGLNRLNESWSPIESGKYSYSLNTYYKNDLKKEEKIGKDKLELYSVPSSDRYIVKTYSYYNNDKLKMATDSAGGKTIYQYDYDSNLAKISTYTSSQNCNVTEFENNYLGKPITKKVYVRTGDITDNAFIDDKELALTTAYKYDLNGNVNSETAADGIKTYYKYDSMNRIINVSKLGQDELEHPEVINISKTYNWNGDVATEKDGNVKTTRYEYDAKGQLIKTVNAKEYVTANYYDRGGRKIAVVTAVNYDSTKKLEEMNRTVFSYDKLDRVITKMEVFKEGSATTFTSLVTAAYKYDSNGNIIKELDGEGYKSGIGSTAVEKINSGYGTENKYNMANEKFIVLDPVSKDKSLTFLYKYDYDGAGRQISETRVDGVIKSFYYNDAGKLLSTTVRRNIGSPEQTIKSNTYDLAGNTISETDGNGNTTRFEYNALGKVRKIVTPGDTTITSNITMYQYDVLGNIAYQEDSMGRIKLYTYDNFGRVLSTTEQNKARDKVIKVSVTYDKAGNKRFETDGNGNSTEYVYNEINQLVEKKVKVSSLEGTPSVQTTKYAYDKNGNQTSVTDWIGNTSTNVYDAINRVIQRIDANIKPIETIEYNANHKQIKSRNALGKLTQFGYDKSGRQVTTTNAEGHTTRQTYNNAGQLSSKTDANGNVTSYEYDQLDRLSVVTNAKGEKTSYTYDLVGNMLTQTDGRECVLRFEYNCANKLVKRIDAGGRTGSADKYEYVKGKVETYTYNANGTMAAKVDRNGKTTYYSYDIYGRLLSETIGSEKKAYTYDNNGNQVSMTDVTGTTYRTYDELNRVKTKKVPQLGVNSYNYDSTIGLDAGFYAEILIDAKGNKTTRIFDKVGRIVKVKDGDNVPTIYTYNYDGSKESVTYPSGVREEYFYYDDGTLKTLTNKRADGTIIDNYSYEYDPNNNQVKKTDSKGITNYYYDGLNRLGRVKEPDGKITEYSFDGSGNRKSEKITKGIIITTTEYTYNEQNRLASTVKNASDGSKETVKYGYDYNGNMTMKSTEFVRKIDPLNPPEPSFGIFVYGQPNTNPKLDKILKGTAVYEYDVWNQMVKSVTGEGTTLHKYNAEGLRVEKSVNGAVTKFLYEADKVILETDGNGKQTARNIQGVNLVGRTIGSETVNYLYNGHGDVVSLINGSGTIKATYYYDAFGNQTETTGDINNPYRYAGYQYDKETGLYYLNARMYDATVARFMQEDTYRGDINDVLSLNLYTYCNNEPIMYTDPTGHKAVSEDGGSGSSKKTTASSFVVSAVKQVVTTVKAAVSTAVKKTTEAVTTYQKSTSTTAKTSSTVNAVAGSSKVSANSTKSKTLNNNKDSNVVSGNSNQGQSNSNKAIEVGNSKILSNAKADAVSSADPDLSGYKIVKDTFTMKEAQKYIGGGFLGGYFSSEIEGLPKVITYNNGYFIETYELQLSTSYIFGVEISGISMTLKNGMVIDNRTYSYNRVKMVDSNTGENVEVALGIIVDPFGIKGAGNTAAFEKKISKMSPNDRVAAVKTEVNRIVNENGLIKDNKLTKINNRDVYRNPDTGELFAVDTQHGRFESLNPKNGKHLGEVDFDFNPISDSIDKSGGHDLKIK